MPSKVIIIVIQFLGINIFWSLLKSHFNPCLMAQAKMSLRQAQNIFMPTNINSIVLLKTHKTVLFWCSLGMMVVWAQEMDWMIMKRSQRRNLSKFNLVCAQLCNLCVVVISHNPSFLLRTHILFMKSMGLIFLVLWSVLFLSEKCGQLRVDAPDRLVIH